MQVTYNKEKLIQVIQILRSNENLEIESMLGLIEEKQEKESKVESTPNNPVAQKFPTKLPPLITRRHYTTKQKAYFDNLIKEHREISFIPNHVISTLSKELKRTEDAIKTQLYEAKERVEQQAKISSPIVNISKNSKVVY